MRGLPGTARPSEMAPLLINNEWHEVDTAGGRRLVDVLRDDLGLLGTKLACGEGACGGAAALVDAFVAEDALQCGFCTPGQIVSASALLARTPQPTSEEIRAAMAGNLCRCGAYPKIERAILRAAGAQA